MSIQTITLTFNSLTSFKIQFIQRAISEPTTYSKVLEGLIDVGYANALKTLYAEGELDLLDYEKGLGELPDYLRKAITS